MTDPLPINVLKFKLSDDGKLFAELGSGTSKPLLSLVTLKEVLVQQGYSQLFLYENALTNLLKQYNNPNNGFVLEIGERRDGKFEIKIDTFKMSARLTLTPPYGGIPVTLSQIQMALTEKGVVSGIMNNEIVASLKEGCAVDRIIAKGLEAVPGIDARFQSLIPEIRERKPQVDKHGIADYRDLGQLIVVKAGNPLMCRTPPTEGKQGRDITGQIIRPKPGRDTKFAPELQGAEIDPDAAFDADDIALLLATITGQPKLIRHGVIVEPTINLPRVDLSTGNIDFDGTINIQGDVKDGMKIHVTGDVFVGGTVEAAEIIADGNIVIKGGVIGCSKQGADSNVEPNFSTKIISKGSISAYFAENAYMEAGMDIMIEAFSMHNNLIAFNQIVVGKSGSKKGKIIGGVTCAAALIKTAIMGSKGGVITKIRAGVNPYLQEQLDQLTFAIDANEKEQGDIKKIIVFIDQHPEKYQKSVVDNLLKNRDKLVADCSRLHADRLSLQSQMILPEDVQVIVEEGVYSGVEVQIGQLIWKNNQNRSKGVFQIVEGQIKFGNAMLSVSVAR